MNSLATVESCFVQQSVVEQSCMQDQLEYLYCERPRAIMASTRRKNLVVKAASWKMLQEPDLCTQKQHRSLKPATATVEQNSRSLQLLGNRGATVLCNKIINACKIALQTRLYLQNKIINVD